MRNLLHSLILLLVALALALVLLPLGLLWTIGEIGFRFFVPSGNSASKKGLGYLGGIFRSVAIGIDQIGNSVCRDLFNRCLITSAGYKFGKVQETISSVLGKNQETGTLTLVGRAVVGVLDWIDKDHCRESIITFTSYDTKNNE
ncbi:hypothetical protein D8B45_00185 [Candidatus Gracilibacteria bacterium]|nr:MAG: hypothetical protein D8B45_00185 [Candidatus Gracilibacteria bacterium]